MIEITIKVKKDIDSSISDILCWLSGYFEGKGKYNYPSWLEDSSYELRDLNKTIKCELEKLIKECEK